jgi:hypothetical protein
VVLHPLGRRVGVEQDPAGTVDEGDAGVEHAGGVHQPPVRLGVQHRRRFRAGRRGGRHHPLPEQRGQPVQILDLLPPRRALAGPVDRQPAHHHDQRHQHRERHDQPGQERAGRGGHSVEILSPRWRRGECRRIRGDARS